MWKGTSEKRVGSADWVDEDLRFELQGTRPLSKKKRSDGGDPELNDYSSGEPLLHHLQ